RRFAAAELAKPDVRVGPDRFGEMKHRLVVDVMLPADDVDDVLRSAPDEQAPREKGVGVERAALAQQAEGGTAEQQNSNRLLRTSERRRRFLQRHPLARIDQRKQIQLDRR